MTLQTLEIVRAGLQTIVVAEPRTGHRAVGVGIGGALDERAFARANALVGNAPEAPALEIAYGAFDARFSHPVPFAMAGADCAARFDGLDLVLDAPRSGVRTYLAVRGGFEIPVVLGSRTTDLRGGFGGWNGRALRNGDVLTIGTESDAATARAPEPPAQYPTEIFVRAIDRRAPAEFWTHPWRVGHESNRMGMRLNGEPLAGGGDVDSHAVFPGVVQLPASGEPIVLLADAQTTGGYRAIASVIQADLWRFAQLPAGATVRFEKVALSDAD